MDTRRGLAEATMRKGLGLVACLLLQAAAMPARIYTYDAHPEIVSFPLTDQLM